jgi:membrane protease YdiL (CAAX protease family)
VKKNLSPGFYFLAFLLALLVALLLAAALAAPVQALIRPVKDAALHRVFTRLAEVGLFAGTWWLLSRLHLFDRRLMGYGTPRTVFLRRLGSGFAGGLAMMVLAVLPLFALGLRALRPDLGTVGELLVAHGPKAVLTGLGVAFVEETYFRGALQGAMTRRGAMTAALTVVPALYAAVHFLGEAMRIPAAEVHWWSGFVVLRAFFSAFAEPLAIWDAFVALWFVGLLLAIARLRTGDIGASVGLHAGFVAVIAFLRAVSVPVEGGAWSWLVGPYDGLLGVWIAAVSALACLVFWRWPPPRQKGLAMTK